MDEEIILSDEDFYEIAVSLQDKHSIFSRLWESGKPDFTLSVPTASVEVQTDTGCVVFKFNPIFWKTLNDYNRKFVICHEMLHLILNHCLRIKNAPKENFPIINKCLDVVVNHLLVNKFGFTRKKLQGFPKDFVLEMNKKSMVIPDNEIYGDYRDFCWVDTVFDPKKHPEFDPIFKGVIPPTTYGFERYYNLFPEKDKSDSSGENTVDCHENMNQSEEIKEILRKLNEDMSFDEKATIRDMIEDHFENGEKDADSTKTKQCGNSAGNIFTFSSIDPNKVKKKRKWETIIEKWAFKKKKEASREMDQWVRESRRLTMIPRDVFLPAEMEVEDDFWEEDRIEVVMAIDTSGSCKGYENRFLKVAASLPKNKFSVKFYTFDTRMYLFDMKAKRPKMFGGGGTSFACIANEVRRLMKIGEFKKHPTVFVITDGAAAPMTTDKPGMYYFFLTDGYTSAIPVKANYYDLRHFE